MLYRVDFNLNPKKKFNIFRQKLVNNSDEVMNVSLTNITSSELIKELRWLQKNSSYIIEQGIISDTGNNGLVDFEVYENMKLIGARRFFITNDYENIANSYPKLIDSKVTDKKSPFYIDKDIDIKWLVRNRKHGIATIYIPEEDSTVDVGVVDNMIVE